MNPARWVETIIRDFINTSPENTLKNEENERAWLDPLVGFSRGDDPLYDDFKVMIGDFYWTPLEIFTMTFSESIVGPDQLTIISWILPQTELTKVDNGRETTYPAERWVRARIFGEEVNEKLRAHVVEVLLRAGVAAVAPMRSPHWKRETSKRYGFASTWSERHAAYVSGLGTFGLCDGLITPRGKAVRCGSVVANIKIPPTNRPYENHQEYCIFFTQGICGKCINRCPAGAITEEGHDKTKCSTYIRGEVAEHVRSHYGFREPRGCGLCQTAVPCESKIPTKQDVEAYEFGNS
ncbi:MAG: epoxyqueuosine reductase [Desulfobacteraceae bacterium]|nr:epoxyqueuosine reductase [Desulfobacteraceae bacterium]